MRNLKYAIDEIVRKPITFFMIIIQIVLSSTLLLQTISSFCEANYTYKMTKNILENKNLYSMSIGFETSNKNDNVSIEDKKDFYFTRYMKLNQNNNFIYLLQFESNILVKDFTDKNEFYNSLEVKYMENPYKNINGKFSNIRCFYISKNYFKEFPLRIEKGRTFKSEDFSKEDIIPIILGNNYFGIYDIGDEFDYFDYFNKKEKKLKIIGILEKNSYYYSSYGICDLKNYIICPVKDIKDSSVDLDNYANLDRGLIIADNKEKALDELRDIYGETNTSEINLESVKDRVDRLINVLYENAKKELSTLFIIVLFLSAGIITVQLNSIEKHLTEYGIHLLSGARKRDILVRQAYLISIYFILGTSIDLFFEYLFKSINFKVNIIIIFIVFYIILAMIIFFFPYRKIKKLQINDIIRGIDR